VSEPGQRGPNSCRPYACDGISRTRQCRAGVDGGQGRRRSGVYQNRCDHVQQQSAASEPPGSRR
jgi:hypothetical protein